MMPVGSDEMVLFGYAVTLTGVIQVLFLPLLVFSVYFFYKSTQVSGKELSAALSSPEFARFQRLYFSPYFMALFSDWLQGPYVYKLYSYYGFDQGQIAILFLMGFASSVTFGTATGPLADKFGRKKLSLIFCLLYTICCLTKLSNSFNILLAGRILGGISTSILFSVFESWYLHQHTTVHKFPMEWTAVTFSKATFFNGVIAIFAGVVADIGADRLGFGPVTPFMIAVPCLAFAAWIIYSTWDENHGVQQMNWKGSCLEGFDTIMKNSHIHALGWVQSIFEANMYIFVFLWTPVLEPGKPPLGLTFSSFMIAIMIGSTIYSSLINHYEFKSEKILSICLCLMSVTMFGCAFFTSPVDGAAAGSISRMILLFGLFMVLEVAVGMYFPSIGYLRGEVIPDGLRANIMNWFRVPLNIITCTALMGMHSFNSIRSNQTLFFICGVTSLIGLALAQKFTALKGFKKTVLSASANGSGKSSKEVEPIAVDESDSV